MARLLDCVRNNTTTTATITTTTTMITTVTIENPITIIVYSNNGTSLRIYNANLP